MTSVIVVGDDGQRFTGTIVGHLRGASDVEAIELTGSLPQLLGKAKGGGQPVVALVSAEGGGWPTAIDGGTDKNGDRPGVIVVACDASPEDVSRALHAGAKGFLLADSPAEEVITAIRAVARGFLFVPSAFLPELAESLLAIRCRDESSMANVLTTRETEVLGLLALGYPNQQIAAKLFISDATVRSHVLRILRKLGVRNRTEAVAAAYRGGLLRHPAADGTPVAVAE